MEHIQGVFFPLCSDILQLWLFFPRTVSASYWKIWEHNGTYAKGSVHPRKETSIRGRVFESAHVVNLKPNNELDGCIFHHFWSFSIIFHHFSFSINPCIIPNPRKKIPESFLHPLIPSRGMGCVGCIKIPTVGDLKFLGRPRYLTLALLLLI